MEYHSLSVREGELDCHPKPCRQFPDQCYGTTPKQALLLIQHTRTLEMTTYTTVGMDYRYANIAIFLTQPP